MEALERNYASCARTQIILQHEAQVRSALCKKQGTLSANVHTCSLNTRPLKCSLAGSTPRLSRVLCAPGQTVLFVGKHVNKYFPF